jgi:hypothetical protein
MVLRQMSAASQVQIIGAASARQIMQKGLKERARVPFPPSPTETFGLQL